MIARGNLERLAVTVQVHTGNSRPDAENPPDETGREMGLDSDEDDGVALAAMMWPPTPPPFIISDDHLRSWYLSALEHSANAADPGHPLSNLRDLTIGSNRVIAYETRCRLSFENMTEGKYRLSCNLHGVSHVGLMNLYRLGSLRHIDIEGVYFPL
jgi:hypothetical protein